jgi:hypothetical protein
MQKSKYNYFKLNCNHFCSFSHSGFVFFPKGKNGNDNDDEKTKKELGSGNG